MGTINKSNIKITLNELNISSLNGGIGSFNDPPNPIRTNPDSLIEFSNVDDSKEPTRDVYSEQEFADINTKPMQESIHRINASLEPAKGKKRLSITRKDKALFDLFTNHLETELKYTDPEFNLKIAARQLGTNEKYLSSAINNCSGISFNALVNRYRIAYAKKLIYDDVLTRQNLEQIAYMSGYANRTTFYRVFTELEGVTPSRFRDNYNKDFTL